MRRAKARLFPLGVVPATIATLAAAACSTADDQASRAEPVRQVIDGVEVLDYPAESARTLDWAADTAAIIGDAMATEAYQFDQASASGLAADGEGAVYLLDRLGSRVLKYDAEGSHLATYGRPGGGPGELQAPIALALGPGDSIWVSEIGGRRITIYPQDGGEPRTVSYPEAIGFPGGNFAVRGDRVLQDFRALSIPGLPGGGRGGAAGPESGTLPGIPLIALDTQARPADTLWTAAPPPTDRVEIGGEGSRSVMMSARGFAPAFRWAATPDGGAVVSDSAAYVLHFVGPDGEVVRQVRRGPPPRATTDADREAARERARQAPAGGGVAIRVEAGPGGVRTSAGAPRGNDAASPLLQARIDAMRFEDVVPRIAGLRVDPAGRVWVGVTEDSPGDVDRIDIYRADGTLLGELRDLPFPDVFLPGGFGLLSRDEYDVQRLVLYRVPAIEALEQ